MHKGMKHAIILFLLLCGAAAFAQSNEDDLQPKPATGLGKVIVHSKFGGQIFGFDIDQNGTEGVLSEALVQNNGTLLAAVETFSQSSGKILKVVSETQTQDDFVTLGVVGASVGLVEHEHVKGIVVSRTFNTMNPLSSNKITGAWSPPIGTKHLIMPGAKSRVCLRQQR